MKTISFKLSGNFAHFKKPDVNSYAFFSYSHIHKPALLGILGAIMGLGGYSQFYETKRLSKKKESLSKAPKYPEFYEKLNSLKVSIIPLKPYFSKKIQTFNNSIGYASKEEGGNLIVKEQWLENPAWEIIVMDDGSDIFGELKNRLQKKEFAFLPYLGKNDHFAKIEDIKETELNRTNRELVCTSLVKKDLVDFVRIADRFGKQVYYEEYLPIGLKENFLIYEFEKFILSNLIVRPKGEDFFEKEGKGVWFG
ncbi:type I-B CRISPR-associated protein Cas5b [Nitrosophilus alvini]|uniref:type I-B CRISPR-associated protein Cas5b n=1 Tax=Nitrosophilus alvini TaxID=2714855 RepID=UPI00190AA618|nr:type I-B CRISPR-associated protein Cas5b [Nitrosophilus alvini]